jgi:hypothetical protein
VPSEARLSETLHVIEHNVNIDRFAFNRALVAEHFHAIHKLDDTIGFFANEPSEAAIVIAD